MQVVQSGVNSESKSNDGQLVSSCHWSKTTRGPLLLFQPAVLSRAKKLGRMNPLSLTHQQTTIASLYCGQISSWRFQSECTNNQQTRLDEILWRKIQILKPCLSKEIVDTLMSEKKDLKMFLKSEKAALAVEMTSGPQCSGENPWSPFIEFKAFPRNIALRPNSLYRKRDSQKSLGDRANSSR